MLLQDLVVKGMQSWKGFSLFLPRIVLHHEGQGWEFWSFGINRNAVMVGIIRTAIIRSRKHLPGQRIFLRETVDKDIADKDDVKDRAT